MKNRAPQPLPEATDGVKNLLIERIKDIIAEQVHYSESPVKIDLSGLLARRLDHSYSYLSAIFRRCQGFTIAHFCALQKVERIKEMLNCGELSIAEIAGDMHYGSAARLSSQFRYMTGMSPWEFKEMAFRKKSPKTS